MKISDLFLGIWNIGTKLPIAPDGTYSCIVTYSDNTVSWYERTWTSSNANASYQANTKNTTYYYGAIG